MPALFNHELRDVVTGETFQMSDFLGQVMVIEAMAVWCPFCTSQQEELKREKA